MQKREIRKARKAKAELLKDPDRWAEETVETFMKLFDELGEARRAREARQREQ
jgi:hypothetical protein